MLFTVFPCVQMFAFFMIVLRVVKHTNSSYLVFFESIISHIQNIFKRVFLEIKNYLTDNLYKHNLCDHYHTMHLFFRANHKNENDPLRNVKSKNEIEKRKGVIGITRSLREKRSYSTVDFLLL